jgi:hypothetical protein
MVDALTKYLDLLRCISEYLKDQCPTDIATYGYPDFHATFSDLTEQMDDEVGLHLWAVTWNTPVGGGVLGEPALVVEKPGALGMHHREAATLNGWVCAPYVCLVHGLFGVFLVSTSQV